MRRSPLTRRTPLRASAAATRDWLDRSRKAIPRRTPLKAVNRTRRAVRFERAYGSEGRAAWVASLGCVVPGCNAGPCENAHRISRGAGGTAEDVFPACAEHHRLQHAIGMREFERRHGLNLEGICAAVALRWRQFIHDEGGAR